MIILMYSLGCFHLDAQEGPEASCVRLQREKAPSIAGCLLCGRPELSG